MRAMCFDEVKVQDILDEGRQFGRADLSVKDFMEQWAVPEQRDYAVVDDERQLVGVFSLQRLRSVPKDRWDTQLIGDLVRRHHPHVYPDDSLDDVLEHMAEEWLSIVPVTDPITEELLGAITSEDVMAYLVERHD